MHMDPQDDYKRFTESWSIITRLHRTEFDEDSIAAWRLKQLLDGTVPATTDAERRAIAAFRRPV
jgi:hypothetical protein